MLFAPFLFKQICFIFVEKKWNMWIPGFGGEELRTYKKSVTTDAHRQVRHIHEKKKLVEKILLSSFV